MTVELIDWTRNAQETIAKAAGVCYGNDNRDVNRIKRLKEHKHLATFRFASATFKVSDISIACQNQFVRSAHLDFLVESKRYVSSANRGFVMPKVDNESRKEIEAYVEAAGALYERLLAKGVAKEDARAILPMNTMTSLYVTGNMQAWISFLTLRVSKHAQKEIRTVAFYIWSTLAVNFPLIFQDLIFDGKSLWEWERSLI